MSEELDKLLKKVLKKETYDYIYQNYEEIKKQKIISSGIESLEYISLLSELEDSFNIEDEKIDIIDTLEDLEMILNGR